MDECGDNRIVDVVVLAVYVQAGSGAEGGIGSRRPGITQRAGGADDGHGGQRREAHAGAQGNVDGGNDGQGGEGAADAHGYQQADGKHNQSSHAFVAGKQVGAGVDQGFDLAGGLHHFGEALGGNHDEADHRHHAQTAVEHDIHFAAAHHAGGHEYAEADHCAQE